MPDRLALAALAALLVAGCSATPPIVGADGHRLACAEPCKMLLDASPSPAWEPHVAVDPSDPRHVAVASRTVAPGETPGSFSAWFDVHVTRDGGATWNVTSLRYTKPLGEGGADEANVVGDPVLAFLPDGTLVATGATLQFVGAQAGLILHVRLYVVRSADGGATFDEPTVVAEGQGVVAVAYLPKPLPSQAAAALLRLPDKPWLAAGPDGTLLLAWADIVAFHPDEPAGARTDIRFMASRDGGRTWTPSRVAATGASLSGPSIAFGSDGRWSIAYVDTQARQTRLAVSRDDGTTWADLAAGPNLWMPSLAVARGPGGDRLVLAASFPAPGSEGDSADDAVQAPSLSWSDDGGATWSEPLLLAEPRPGRVLPSVAVDGAGVAYATFAHAEPEDSDAPVSYRAVAIGPDGARSDLVLDPLIAAPASSLGDYLGLAAGSEGAYATWVTTADGDQSDLAGAALRMA